MLKSVIICTLCLAGVSFAQEAKAGLEDDLANICAIVQADDKSELRKKMRVVQSNHSLKLRDYYQGITCGDKSLIRVALANNASEAGILMVKNMPKKSLLEPEADGKTILAWVDDQGLASHPIALAVKERI